MNNYFNPQSPPSQRQKNRNKFNISGEKGNYHLEYLDKDLYKYKFDISCNQVPIPYGVKLDNGDVSMFRNKGNNNSKKNTIPSFMPLGDELLKDILPKFLEKKREREAKSQKIKRKTKNDDEEYKPTKKELDEIQEEERPPQSRSKRANNKRNSPFGSISKSKKDNNNNPRVIRLRGGRDDDEEYIPTQNELDEAQEEEKPLEKKGGSFSSNQKTEDKKSGFANFFSNKGSKYQRPAEQPFTQLYEGALMTPTPRIGEALYKGAHVVHTLVRVYDGKNDVFIESYCENDENDPLYGHNVVNIFDAKDLDYKRYHPVKGSKGNLNLTADQLINSIEMDQGTYEPTRNDCVTVSEELLKHADNNNGINIINGMKLNKDEVRQKMEKYLRFHPFIKSEIQNYLKKQNKK